MAVCAVTRHAEHRLRGRVGFPKKAVRRAAAKCMTDGIKRTETTGPLRRYLDSLYLRGGCSVDNIMVYGDLVYMFNDNTLVTVLIVPAKHRKQAAKMMANRKEQD